MKIAVNYIENMALKAGNDREQGVEDTVSEITCSKINSCVLYEWDANSQLSRPSHFTSDSSSHLISKFFVSN